MKVIATIENCPVTEHDDGKVTFTAKAAIDNDGSDNRQHDPYWQADTSLHFAGKAIDSEKVPGIVVPPAVIRGVKGVVLGCSARVSYRGITQDAVVFDVGPRAKIGEITPELARRLGINPSALHGGVDAHVVDYALWPGHPAIVDDVHYTLKPSA
jgi:hypothetical protein